MLVDTKGLNLSSNVPKEELEQEGKLRIHPVFQDRINCGFVATSAYHQNIFRSTGILKSLIRILDWDIIYQKYNSRKVTLTLLRKIYEIMSFCCQKNQKNKAYLIKYLNEPFMIHFNSRQGIGAIGFLNHLLDGN